MTILTDGDILGCINDGSIVIKPFSQDCLGSNSYDVHLGNTIARYVDPVLDAKKNNSLQYEVIDENEGYLLQPGELYLGVTEEYTESHKHVPFLEGKSSTGRLSISIHATAGKGDVGFCGHWTLEISCVKPVRVYAGMPIGQLIYFTTNLDTLKVPYNKKKSAKYSHQPNLPVGSQMYRNHF